MPLPNLNINEILDWMNSSGVNYTTIRNFNFSNDKPNVVLRHDIDGHPRASVWMLKNEQKHGAKSISYFLPIEYYLSYGCTIVPQLKELQKFESLGWEMGIHFLLPQLAMDKIFPRCPRPSTNHITFYTPLPEDTASGNYVSEQFNVSKKQYNFDHKSFACHGDTDLMRYAIAYWIELKCAVVEYTRLLFKHNFAVHVSDSSALAGKNKALDRHILFFFYTMDFANYVSNSIYDQNNARMLDERKGIKLVIDNMKPGNTYSFLFHSQFWNEEGQFTDDVRSTWEFENRREISRL